MRYYAPKQRNSDGLWHYTCTHNDRTTAVGYCSPYKACEKCWDERGVGTGQLPGGSTCETCEGTGLRKKSQPCEGHPTAEEACQHYFEYVTQKAIMHVDLEGKARSEKCSAPGCTNLANGYASSVGHWYYLCTDHLNKAGLKQVVKIGTSWES